MRTFGDIKTDVLVKLSASTTIAYYTDTIINTWINDSYKWACAYKKWPFTEGRVSTTYTTTEEWSFEGYKADSFRILEVGGKMFEKLNFEDYKIYKEVEPSGTDKVFTDFGRILFINTASGASGTLTAYGQFVPANIDVTDLTATTVFTDGDEDAHDAMVEEVLYYASLREKKDQVAFSHHARAMQILDSVWGKVADESFNYKTSRSRGGMFTRFNILGGGFNDDLNKRDQFPFG